MLIMGIILILFIMVLCCALKCRRSTTAASIETDSDHDKSKEDESGNTESETVTPVWHCERNLHRASISFCNTKPCICILYVSYMYDPLIHTNTYWYIPDTTGEGLFFAWTVCIEALTSFTQSRVPASIEKSLKLVVCLSIEDWSRMYFVHIVCICMYWLQPNSLVDRGFQIHTHAYTYILICTKYMQNVFHIQCDTGKYIHFF